MTASLILSLVTIAGLGILSLVLIFFGSSKKPQQAKPVNKEKPVAKKLDEEKSAPRAAANNAAQHKEPFISADDADLILVEKELIVKTPIPAVEEVDPAIASLGFSALDDLLPEPTEQATIASLENDTSIIAPAEFNSSPKNKIKSNNQTILVLHVMARESQPFVGYELLQAVNDAGLRFGKMDIFHYYDEQDPENILFSLCSAVEPGSFNIANMGALVCPGLSLFMRVGATGNPKAVFNLMLEAAGQLADDLAGYVCDERRQPLTDEKLHDYLKLTMEQSEYVE